MTDPSRGMPTTKKSTNNIKINNIGTEKMTSPKSSYNTKSKRSSSISALDEAVLLDTLRQGFGIRNDAQLAAWLGIDKSLIYLVRSGKRRLGIMQRLKILDQIGFLTARKFVEAILPENLARELKALSNFVVENKIAATSEDEKLNANITLLNVTKDAFSLSSDVELAEFLCIESNSISTIRSGKSSLGPKPRLRILERITGAFHTDNLINMVESSRKLSRLVDIWAKQQLGKR